MQTSRSHPRKANWSNHNSVVVALAWNSLISGTATNNSRGLSHPSTTVYHPPHGMQFEHALGGRVKQLLLALLITHFMSRLVFDFCLLVIAVLQHVCIHLGKSHEKVKGSPLALVSKQLVMLLTAVSCNGIGDPRVPPKALIPSCSCFLFFFFWAWVQNYPSGSTTRTNSLVGLQHCWSVQTLLT